MYNSKITFVFKVKDTAEAEELDEKEEDEEDDVVPVESESYVNLRKKMVTKHNLKIDNLLQENSKLCREFLRKKVKGAICDDLKEICPF